jgi:hypothetical protein
MMQAIDEMAPVAHQSRRIIPGVDIVFGDNSSETPEVEEGENENVPTSETEPTTVEEGEL